MVRAAQPGSESFPLEMLRPKGLTAGQGLPWGVAGQGQPPGVKSENHPGATCSLSHVWHVHYHVLYLHGQVCAHTCESVGTLSASGHDQLEAPVGVAVLLLSSPQFLMP